MSDCRLAIGKKKPYHTLIQVLLWQCKFYYDNAIKRGVSGKVELRNPTLNKLGQCFYDGDDDEDDEL